MFQPRLFDVYIIEPLCAFPQAPPSKVTQIHSKTKSTRRGIEDRTPHCTHHRRTFFLVRARHFIDAHALAQDELSIRVCNFSLKSSCRHMFHRNLLGAPDRPLLFPTTLVTESGTTCADPRSVHGLAGWLNRAPIQESDAGNLHT